MKTRLALVAVAIAGLFTASFALASPNGAALHLTAKDNNKTVTAPVGATIFITLKSPDSDSGYYWKRGPSSKVKYVSHHEVSKKIPGCNGVPCRTVKDVWRFKVVGPMGNGKIRLSYVTAAKKVDHRFTVSLRVG